MTEPNEPFELEPLEPSDGPGAPGSMPRPTPAGEPVWLEPLDPSEALGSMPRPMPPAGAAGAGPLDGARPAYPLYSPYPAPAPPPPPRLAATPPARDRFTAWKMLVWFALVVVVSGIVVLQHVGADLVMRMVNPSGAEAAERLAEQEKQRADLETDATPSDFALRFHGRMAVGLKQMTQSQSANMRPRQQQQQERQMRDMVEQTDAFAGTLVERQRVAMLAGEVVGADEAIDRLTMIEYDLEDRAEQPGHDAMRDDIGALMRLYSEGPNALTPEQRQRLIDRHQWFGELAVTHGLKPSDSELRQRVVASGYRTLIGMMLAFVAAGVAGMVGLVLLMLAIVFAAKGKMRRGFEPDRRPESRGHVAYLEMFVIFLVGVPALSLLALWLGQYSSQAVATQVVWLLLLTPLWLRIRGISWPRIRAALGWHNGRGVWREAGCGVLGYLAALPLLFLGLIGMFVLMAITQVVVDMLEIQGEPGPPPSHPIVGELMSAGFFEVLLVFSLACMWAPIVEETLFRGAFQHYLRRRWSIPLTTLVVAFVFAAIHPQGYLGVPPLMAIGATLSLVREWRGSLIAPIVTHACNNTVMLTLVLLLFR